MSTLTLTRPDDWHLHVRDGEALAAVVPDTARRFGRALITVGKLVAVDRTLRDVHRFGFASLSKMKDEADKILGVALERIGQNPAVAGL